CGLIVPVRCWPADFVTRRAAQRRIGRLGLTGDDIFPLVTAITFQPLLHPPTSPRPEKCDCRTLACRVKSRLLGVHPVLVGLDGKMKTPPSVGVAATEGGGSHGGHVPDHDRPATTVCVRHAVNQTIFGFATPSVSHRHAHRVGRRGPCPPHGHCPRGRG